MAEATVYRDLFDCPAQRLGEALRQHREAVGMSFVDICKRVDFSFTPVVLQMIEAGQYPLEPAQVLIAVWGYDADPDRVLPIRDALNLDVNDRKLRTGPTVREIRQTLTPTVLLYEYLAFLYDLRGVEPGTAIPLRDADLAVLSNTTDWPIEDIREHLTVLMSRWHQADPYENYSLTSLNRTGVLGASVPVGLKQRFAQHTESA